MTDRWTDDHLRLARAAVTVRDALRRLLPKLDHQSAPGSRRGVR
jgi:hypothetical protein